MRALFLALGLTLLPLAAGAATPAELKAQVTQKVHQVDIYAQARTTLLKERAAQQARANELSASVNAAKRNRGLLGDAQLKALLREALEVSRALENTDRKLAALDQMMADAAVAARDGLRLLAASDRKALEPEVARVAALVPAGAGEGLPAGLDIRVTPGMDAEALQERADLALDYEEKMLREAARAEARIRELEAQASLAGEAQHLAGDRRLFDEEDRAMRATRVVGRTSPAAATAADTRANGATGGAGANETQTGNSPPPGGGGNAAPGNGTPTGAFNGADDTNTTTRGECTGGNCGTPNAPATGGSVTGLPRSQTVVDERTFALLRESRSPLGQQSPADELRQLQARRDALRKQAARLKALRDELAARAAAARGTPANTR